MSKSKFQLSLPCLIRSGNWLIAADSDGLKELGLRHEADNLFSYPESVSAKPHLHWIIESNGIFREFTIMGFEREWLRPFRIIWPLVRVRCLLLPGKSLSVGEVRFLLDSIQKDGASINDELRIDLQLIEFLKPYTDTEMFTPELTRAFLQVPDDI